MTVTPAASALPSAAEPLFILAMDHRDSFARTVFGVPGTPTAGQLTRMREAKSLIFAAARRVVAPSAGRLGVLVDEHLGADVAREARAAGFVLAMPAEVSGADRLTFEYGDDFARHVEEFDPDWVKVLVRFNPADPADLRAAQTETLRRLNDWVAGAGRNWLIELLVPPTREQLAAHDDQALYDAHQRPALTAEVITTLTAAGIRPGIWKLEGYETTPGAELVLAAVRDSAHPASCIVLGRNAAQRQVDHWLRVAAPLPGYVGFAVGRSIWEDPITDYEAGRGDAEGTQARIARRYSHFIQRYLAADPALAGESAARLTPALEAEIRAASAAADAAGGQLPAWMTQSVLAELDSVRSGR